jgi:hypothetical protein
LGLGIHFLLPSQNGVLVVLLTPLAAVVSVSVLVVLPIFASPKIMSLSGGGGGTTATFSWQVTLGYGVDRKTEAALNKVCCFLQQQHNTTKSLTELASQYFFPDTKEPLSVPTATSSVQNDKPQQDNPCIVQHEAFFVASASEVQLTMDEAVVGTNGSNTIFAPTTTSIHTRHVAVFVPPHIMGSCLERHFAISVDGHDTQKAASSIVSSQRGSSFWVNPPFDAQQFAQDLLPKLLPPELFWTSEESVFVIKGIILTSLAANSPADIVLLQVANSNLLYDSLQRANGASVAADKTCILKILPTTSVKFLNGVDTAGQQSSLGGKKQNGSSMGFKMSPSTAQAPLLPTCPVCIHRIDPVRLGMPAPTNQHLCSRFCPSPIGNWGVGTLPFSSLFASDNESCPKQKFLHPWPAPARCRPCRVIQEYWNFDKAREHHPRNHFGMNHHADADEDLFCEECSMHKTLWTCLTCGFVGCGRYSNKHSVAHFEQTRHPYSLELATLRVWDYCHGQYGGFVQRPDLLECPSSPPLAHPWMIRGIEMMDGSSGSSYHSSRTSNAHHPSLMGDVAARIPEVEKSSKKVGMIGDEYEVLLQSALEDQSQYYEGEITKLRSELTSALVDKITMSPEEVKEIDFLKAEVTKVQQEIEVSSKELLEVQAQEAVLRAESQELLSQQQKSNEILKKIQTEHQRENEQGKLQIEDLEQQVADLSANLRMRQQFSQSEELNQAQIFGTMSSPDSKPLGNKRGKKKGRLFRK